MDLFNFVKDQLEITQVINEYTSLKKTGSMYWKGLCPFHHEKTPSFTVSPHKKIFYCFGCHETGDVINFIEKMENVSAFQATQHLVERYNLEVPETVEKSCSIKREKTSFQLCQLVAQWCNDKLLNNKPALDYLHKRDVNKHTVSQFIIGLFPSGTRSIQSLISYILNNGFTSQDLLNEHILFQGKGVLYSPFENRIMFPIKDHLGQVCGFGGRVFKPQDERPKYYNSKETKHFKKGKILFGLDVAKHEIHKQKTAFIVEGYTDCIAMHQHGYKNTVATLGTACSVDHLKQLTRHAQTVYMLYDGDNAGKQAMLKLTESCWQLDMDLKVVLLPPNQDPASILEQEKSLDTYLAQANDIFSYFLARKGENFAQQSLKDKMLAITDLIDVISKTSDNLRKNILFMKASEVLQVPLEILKKEYNNKHKQVTNQEPEKPQQQSSQEPTEELELQILAAIVHDPSIVTKQYKTLLFAKLTDPIKELLSKIIPSNNDTSSTSLKLEEILTPKELQFVQQISFRVESTNMKQMFQSLMVQFQKKHWKSLTAHIKMKLLQAKQANNVKEIQELLDVFENLKKDLYKNGRL